MGTLISALLWTAVEATVFGVALATFIRDRQVDRRLTGQQVAVLVSAVAYLLGGQAWTWTTEGTPVRIAAEIISGVAALGLLLTMPRMLIKPLHDAAQSLGRVGADRPECHQEPPDH